MSDARRRPLVLVQCGWPRDRELIGELLGSLGADMWPMGGPSEIRRLLAEDRVDLVLADTAGGQGALAGLLEILDGKAESGELPMVLLADPEDLTSLADLTVRRFNAVLLTKPMGREPLVAAIESGLRFRDRQREVKALFGQLTEANDRLATANAALELRREEAAEEARRKTRFLSAISHDIRTPVNALVLSCELLRAVGQGDPAPGEVHELTEGLLANSASLVELVNDLLDIARYDQGKLEFAESEFLLGPFLSATLEAMRPLAGQKRLALIAEIATPAATIQTDRVKLARVVQNLVANAIKFTEAGEIRVAARAGADSGLTLSVADTGVGIPESMRESIFDEFSQLRNPERDRTKGTGLGLAICRRLVTAMGGEIRVATEPGQRGSTFRVSLPPARVVEPPPVVPDPDPDPPATAPADLDAFGRYAGRALIVEDHEPSRVLLRRLLQQSGLTVDVAATGREALAALDRSRPDLVLMDLMMPEMGGLEALKIIRSRPEYNGLPVVILTGDLGDRGDTHLAHAGATACLSKPVEFPKLFELLDRLVPVVPRNSTS